MIEKVIHTAPWFWPLLSVEYRKIWAFWFWNSYSRWCILHFVLSIRGYCICCLSWTSWKSWYNVHDFPDIWDADDSCSVNTAYEPESLFTMSPRSTTLPLYFWHWDSSSEFLRWQRSINDAKWTFLHLFLASSITSFFFLTFVRCHAGIFSSFSISFSTAVFASGIFKCLRQRSEFVNKTLMSHRIRPFCSDVILMRLVSSSF